MPAKAHQWTRREMNRLVRVVAAHAKAHPPLEAMRSMIVHCADELNTAWADYRRTRAKKPQVEDERALSRFVQRWRPVVILLVPGATERLGELPPRGGRSLVAYAEQLVSLVRSEPGEERLAEILKAELDVSCAAMEEALSDAEDAAGLALSDAAQRANIVLFHTLDALRACVGEDSEVYRDFAVDLPWDQDVLRTRPWEPGDRELAGR
jgi:hypothetical protein